jgi:hypothetical protein
MTTKFSGDPIRAWPCEIQICETLDCLHVVGSWSRKHAFDWIIGHRHYHFCRSLQPNNETLFKPFFVLMMDHRMWPETLMIKKWNTIKSRNQHPLQTSYAKSWKSLRKTKDQFNILFKQAMPNRENLSEKLLSILTFSLFSEKHAQVGMCLCLLHVWKCCPSL